MEVFVALRVWRDMKQHLFGLNGYQQLEGGHLRSFPIFQNPLRYLFDRKRITSSIEKAIWFSYEAPRAAVKCALPESSEAEKWIKEFDNFV